MRLALAQINTTVGDLEGNKRKILSYCEKARDVKADIAVFPEMALTGYPPEDLLLKPDFIENTMAVLQEIIAAGRDITLIVGTVFIEDDLYNSAVAIHNGTIAGVQHKRFLPNYGVFDENRYFRSSIENQVFVWDGTIFGISVCEDIWYPDGPSEEQAALGGAELLINISSSPYHIGKGLIRERMLCTRAADNTAFVAYCNLVGGQDELIFDGQSLICGPQGNIVAREKQFEEQLVVADIDLRQVFRWRLQDTRQRKVSHAEMAKIKRIELDQITRIPKDTYVSPVLDEPLENFAEVYHALVLGTRDYVYKNGFKQAVIGLSGGIDSSLVASIAVDAIGSENVIGVAMPTRYSSTHSLDDAQQLAGNLGIKFI